MIVSAFAGVGKTTLAQKYSSDVIDLESGNYRWLNSDGTEQSKGTQRVPNPRFPINYLEAIKAANQKYKVVLISQHEVIRKCLDAVKLDYILAYPDMGMKEEFIERYRKRGNNENFIRLISTEWEKWIQALDNVQTHNKIVLQQGQYLTDYVVELGLEEYKEHEEQPIENKVTEEVIDVVTEQIVETVDNSVEKLPQVIESKDITISKMMEEGFYIDDLTLREFKIVENKVRAGMLIQAKNRLNRVDRLLETLNKLEDELFNRIEDDITTMRTDRIIETTKFISSLIKDTNEMVMSVIGNPKLQNFFIVDNSSNVTVEDTGGLDVNKRKRIRHAVQVVLENLDKVEEGNVDAIENPNIIVETAPTEEEGSIDGNT